MTVLSSSPSAQLVAYALLLNEWFDYQDCGYDLNSVIFLYIFYLSLLLFSFPYSFRTLFCKYYFNGPALLFYLPIGQLSNTSTRRPKPS